MITYSQFADMKEDKSLNHNKITNSKTGKKPMSHWNGKLESGSPMVEDDDISSIDHYFYFEGNPDVCVGFYKELLQ